MRDRRVVMLTMLAIVVAVLGGWSSAGLTQGGPRIGQPAPEITGGPWINSGPLSMEKLRGRVVFVEFWTFG